MRAQLSPHAAASTPLSLAPATAVEPVVCFGSIGPAGAGTAGGALDCLERCPRCGVDPCACAELAIDAGEALEREPELLLHEWPIPRSPHRPGPLERWRARRAELLASHAARACVHPAHGLGELARAARDRMQAVEERLTSRDPSAEQLELARRTLATVGAILLTLDEQLNPR